MTRSSFFIQLDGDAVSRTALNLGDAFVRIALSNGGVALVDANDLPLVSGNRWHKNSRGYVVRSRQAHPQTVMIHRQILGATPGQAIDHINGDKLDNRRANLRFCTKETNAYNAAKKRVVGGASSSFKGVERFRDQWRARIRFQKKRIHLGLFATEEAAAKAYDTAARHYFGEFARPNFPEALDG